MAVVKNKTPDVLALFRADAPPIDPGGEVTINDDAFVNHAWPTSTWELVKGPSPAKDFKDASTEDAIMFVRKGDDAGEGEG